MTATKTIIQNSPNRTTLKIVGTAGADTSTIYIRTTSGVSMTSPGNLTFNAGSRGTGTIVRSSGSWATDLGTTGAVAYVTFTGTVSNNKTFSVVSIGGTGNNTLTVQESVIAEVVTSAATPTAYRSDVGFLGQTINSGATVNITNAKFSLAGTCSVVRNSATVLLLNGTWMAINDGFGLAESNSSDVVVTFNTAGGTLILEMAKINGFNIVDSMLDV